MADPISNSIRSLHDLKRAEQALRLRIQDREEALRERINHVPGELFYSGVDNILPNIIKGKISSLALGAGRGVINGIFLKKAPVAQAGFKILQKVKPSGLIKKASSVVSGIFKKRRP